MGGSRIARGRRIPFRNEMLVSGPSETSLNRTLALTPSLVLRLRAGEVDAAELLDELYRDVLFRFCWGYLRRRDDCEDAVQDICCKVLAAREIPEGFRPWLYKVARNHCLNVIRRRGRHPDENAGPPPSGLAGDLTGQLTRLVRNEDNARLADMVDALPDIYQEVLRLRYVEELSRAEIAEILDLPESLVKSRLFDGLRKLRLEAGELDSA